MGVESRSPPPASRRLRLAGRSLPGQRQLLAQAHWEPRLSLCTALSRPNPLFLPDIFHLLSPIFPHAAPPPPAFFTPFAPSVSFPPALLVPYRAEIQREDSPPPGFLFPLHGLPFFPSNLASRRESLRVLLSLLSFLHSLSLCFSFRPFSTPLGNRYGILDRESLFLSSIRPPPLLPRFPFQLFHQFSPLRRSSNPVIAVTGFSE